MIMSADKKTEDPFTLSVKQTISSLIIDELGQMIYPSDEVRRLKKRQPSPFIKFLPIAVCIEYLGACFDSKPFDCSDRGISEKRFNIALEELFPNKYRGFNKNRKVHYLYSSFRCAMIHQLRPTGGIIFTTRLEASKDNRVHLQINEKGLLSLVLEDFYDDLLLAATRLIEKFENGTLLNLKGDEGYIGIIP